MSKKSAQAPRNPSATATPAAQPTSPSSAGIGKDTFFRVGLGLFFLAGALLFKARLDLMGDDADYILDAWYFVHTNTYPAFRASLYGLTLGLPVALFGTNVILLKCFSFACAIAAWVLLYRAFRDRVPAIVLYPVLIFSAISHQIQYYSSSNLSEAFFMMIQYGYLALIFALISRLGEPGRHTRHWGLTGLGGLLLSLSKNVAVAAPISLSVYFLLKKQWKRAGLSLGVVLLFKFAYDFLIRLIYGAATVVGQMGQVMAKDMYHPEYGTEDFAGFLNRFWQNMQIYFSGTTMRALGINIGEGRIDEGGTIITALIIGALMLYALRVAFVRKNDYMLLAGLYTGVMTVVTFFALQPAVAQDRIYLMLMLYALYDLATRFAGSAAKWLMGVPMAIIGILVLINTGKEIEKSFPELTENLAGDTFYGYTPDWMDYLEMGQWVAENIPADSVVAARKPNSLTVYTNGRPFYGIYKFPTDKSADELLEILKQDRVSYMILASIRINPEQYIPNYYISTLHNWVSKIAQKYPEKIKMIHQTKGPEPSYLVKIEY
jgi:hypothetical protein